MRKWLGFLILLGVTAGAVYFTDDLLRQQDSESQAAIPQAGESLFPGLYDKLNDAASLTGMSGGEAFEIKRDGDSWIIPSKESYAADAAKLRQLLIGVAGLERLEPKTANSDLYGRIGLGDPSDAESEAIHLVASDADGNELFNLLLGDRTFAKGDSTRSEIYVRVGEDPQSWLVTGKLPEGRNTMDWIARQLVDISRDRIKQVIVTHADGEVVTVARENIDSADFEYLELPEGAELDQQWRVNDIGRALSELEFDDVAKADSELADAEPAFSAVMQTFDGLELSMTAMKVADDTFATLRAEVIEVAPAEGEAGTDDAKPDEEQPAEQAAPEAEAVDVTAEAEAFNQRWANWRYKLPRYKSDNLNKKAATLIKVPEPQENAESQGSDLGLPPVFDLKAPTEDATDN